MKSCTTECCIDTKAWASASGDLDGRRVDRLALYDCSNQDPVLIGRGLFCSEPLVACLLCFHVESSRPIPYQYQYLLTCHCWTNRKCPLRKENLGPPGWRGTKPSSAGADIRVESINGRARQGSSVKCSLDQSQGTRWRAAGQLSYCFMVT